MLKSELGVQQGDPLGPFLFSMVLHSLFKLIEEPVLGLDVHVWYLDDGTIIGDIDLVVRVLSVIEEFGPRLGGSPQPRKVGELVAVTGQSKLYEAAKVRMQSPAPSPGRDHLTAN